jgi:hypothetical protein
MSTDTAPDAELIRLCDRLVQLRTTEVALIAADQEVDLPDDAEWRELSGRARELRPHNARWCPGDGRCVVRCSDRCPDGEVIIIDLAEEMAISISEWMAGNVVAPQQSVPQRNEEIPTTPYRRIPPDIASWKKTSTEEFPWHGMAEVMLPLGDAEIDGLWRDNPGAALRAYEAFRSIGLRWLAGAETMAGMMRRMAAALERLEAESEGGDEPD